MTTALINPTSTGTRHTERSYELPTGAGSGIRTSYLEAAALVAELDLDDRRLWHRVDRVVAELASAAYDLAAALTGTRAGAVAAYVPPVVRVRELASAQRRLFAALDQNPADGELLAWADRQARQLVERLQRNVGAWPSR
jgi:hypothetical protein